LVAKGIDSGPEPDLMGLLQPGGVAYGTPRTKPLLVVEVADSSSLDVDLGKNAVLFAEALVPEYWVVNLVEHLLVVFREPDQGSYRVRLSLEEGLAGDRVAGAFGHGVGLSSAEFVHVRSGRLALLAPSHIAIPWRGFNQLFITYCDPHHSAATHRDE